MLLDARKCLEDVRYRAAAILQLQAGRTFGEFQSDISFAWAVERAFSVIGEAIRRLEKIDPTLTAEIPNYRQIISFRHVLVHGYDIVDLDVVWKVICDDVPGLLKAVDALLIAQDE